MKLNMLTRILLTLTLVALGSSAINAGPNVGEPAPDLGLEQVLQGPAGTEVSWAKLHGKVVVLEFWATWCAPCIAAIPHLNELADHFKGKPVQFIAITDEQSKVVEGFLRKRAMRAWVGLDTDKSMFKAYAVSGIPHTVVVNTNGVIEGITYPMSLKAEHIENLLAGKPAGFPASKPTDAQVKAGSPSPEEKPPLFQVVLRPSDEPSGSMRSGAVGKSEFGIMHEHNVYGTTLAAALPSAFGVSSARLITEAELPKGNFDLLVRLPQKQSDRVKPLLQDALRTSFGLVSRREERESDVFLLKVREAGHKGLQETASTGGMSSSSGPGRISTVKGRMSGLARSLESALKTPVFNETGLQDDYDYDLTWPQKGQESPDPEVVIEALRKQLGLDLVRSRRPVEFVIVEAERALAETK